MCACVQALWVGQGLFNLSAQSQSHVSSSGAATAPELPLELPPAAINQARSCFVRALELAPNHLSARIGLGLTAFHSGDTRQSELHLRKYLELNPSDAAALNLLVCTNSKCCALCVACSIVTEQLCCVLGFGV